jgi:hypothetical protein
MYSYLYLSVHHISVIDICSNKPFPPRGLISSPNYPNNYPKDQQCTRTLLPSVHNALIQTELVALDTESRIGTTGCYDKLTLTGETVALYFEYCGLLEYLKESPKAQFAKLDITFYSNPVETNMKGFLIYYKGM